MVVNGPSDGEDGDLLDITSEAQNKPQEIPKNLAQACALTPQPAPSSSGRAKVYGQKERVMRSVPKRSNCESVSRPCADASVSFKGEMDDVSVYLAKHDPLPRRDR